MSQFQSSIWPFGHPSPLFYLGLCAYFCNFHVFQTISIKANKHLAIVIFNQDVIIFVILDDEGRGYIIH